MNKIWIIPICLGIIGYFGIFWTMNLANIEFSIKMDNNTLEAVKSINYSAMDKIENQVPLENFTGSYIFQEQNGYFTPPENYTLVQVYRRVCSGLGYETGCRYFKEDIYFPKNKGGLIENEKV